PVFVLDTDYLFPETFAVRDRIIAKYGIRPVAVKPLLTIDEQSAQHGWDLFGRQPDLCCKIRKVEPLKRHLGGFQAWITGIRRDQAPTRANAGLVEWDKQKSTRLNSSHVATSYAVFCLKKKTASGSAA